MRLALVSDTFPPLRTSGAVQLRDLAAEFARQGHALTIITASPELPQAWAISHEYGAQVIRLKTPKIKEVGHLRRSLNEFMMPWAMRRALHASGQRLTGYDGVIWYSPSIFLGPMASALKTASACPSYLIIRDIFPEWALDMGLLGPGLPYRCFKAIANYQYSVADTIGVQTSGNRSYFARWQQQPGRKLEVLENWLAPAPNQGCSIRLAETCLAGKKIFVYAGNMGVAQGAGILLELAERMRHRTDVGFLFVGRGSDAQRLKQTALDLGLGNIMFSEEIEPDEIPGLYAQCHIGLVTLDPRHRSHNIPGKFLSYMACGLPVLAAVNPGNDLISLIETQAVGEVCTDHSAHTLHQKALRLLELIAQDPQIPARCQTLAAERFSPDAAVRQIIAALRTSADQCSDEMAA